MTQDNDACAVNVNTNENNRQGQARNQVGLATSIAPSLVFEGVTLEKPAVEEIDASVVIDLSFSEGIASPDALRWYDNADYTQYLRIRVVGCFGKENSQELDFISQRFNDYSSDLMNTQGVEGVAPFIRALIDSTDPAMVTNNGGSLISEAFKTTVTAAIGPLGPLDVQQLNLEMKNGDTKVNFCGENNSSFANLIVYDAPIEDLFQMEMDENGRQKQIRQITPQTVTVSAAGDTTQTYVTEKAFLKPVVLDIDAEEIQREQLNSRDQRKMNLRITDHLSLYAFMYFDYEEFFEGHNVGEDLSPQIDMTGLEAGMGFMNASTFVGSETTYKAQAEGEAPIGPLDPITTVGKAGSQLQDLRNLAPTKAPPVDHSIFEDIDQALTRSGLDRDTVKVIKKIDYFSNLWISKDSTGSARFCFAFDRVAFLAQNSLFPALYRSPAVAEELINGAGILSADDRARIINIRMKKKRIHFEGYAGSINGLSIVRNIPTSDEYRSPEEVVNNVRRLPGITLTDPNVEMFEGHDSYADHFKAGDVIRYQYGTEIALYDPSLVFLERLSKKIQAAERQVREIYDMILNSPPITQAEMAQPRQAITDGVGLYNRVTGRREAALGTIYIPTVDRGNSDESAQTKLDRAIALCSRYLKIIALWQDENTSEGGIASMMTDLADSPNPYGIKEVADIIGNFATYLNDIIGNVLPNNSHREGDVSQTEIFSQSGQDGILVVDKYFEEFFEYGKDYGNGYDYIFGTEDHERINAMEGIPRIARNQFNNRLTLEFSKYFGHQSPNVDISDSPFGPSSELFADSAYRFITPKVIKTYGAPDLDQTDFRNDETNEINYDIDRYAKLFTDLAKIKRATKYLNYPFYYLPNSEPPALGFNVSLLPLLQNLEKESCSAAVGIAEEVFVSLQSSESPPGPTASPLPPGSSPLMRSNEQGASLLSTVLGSMSGEEEGYVQRTTDNLRRSPQDSENEETPEHALAPIKLLFGIFGELELSPGTTYNSIAGLSLSEGLDQDNIIAAIQNRYRDLPNQIKALLVMGAAQNTVSIGPGALQVVRTKLEDADPAPAAKSIGAILEGVQFPPYSLTSDPMKIYSKFLTFWMNYKQIAVIEYLETFTPPSNANAQTSLGTPQWRKFSDSGFRGNDARTLLCRLRPLDGSDLPEGVNIKVDSQSLFDMDFYNQYFVIEPAGI